MEILTFQFCDLGPAPEGFYDCWGASFQSIYDDSVIGTGRSAAAAYNDALDQLALDGLGTKLMHEAGVEYGFFSGSANVLAKDIELHYDPDEDDEPCDEYHVGIRFQNPEPDDEGELV